MSGNTAPSMVATAPYPPSSIESKFFYYGIPSQPRLVARSSLDVWLEPTGPEAYFLPKESSPIGLHPLREIWEATVGPDMVLYLDSKGVEWTSLDPVRMGYASESSPPVIVWIGVVPGSLTAEKGVEVATQCRNILSAYNIDIHVEIRESVVLRSAGPKMYEPVLTSHPTVRAREPFSTALGLPICAEAAPSFEGTGGFYVSDPSNSGKIYLVTARHVVFHPDKERNNLHQHLESSQRRNVLLFGDAAIEKHITAIESEIGVNLNLIKLLERRLEGAKQRRENVAEAEKNQILPQLKGARKAIEVLEELHVEVSKNWKSQENRILGHVVLSPPIGIGEEEFMEDWAVIEIDGSKVDSTNFVGNVIDLGTTIPFGEFMAWMSPHLADPTDPSPLSFEYPEDRLLRFSGTISDDEMWKPTRRPSIATNHALWSSSAAMPPTSLLDASTPSVRLLGSTSRASLVRCQSRLPSCLATSSQVPSLGLVTLAQPSSMARAGLPACSLVPLELPMSLMSPIAPTLPPSTSSSSAC